MHSKELITLLQIPAPGNQIFGSIISTAYGSHQHPSADPCSEQLMGTYTQGLQMEEP